MIKHRTETFSELNIKGTWKEEGGIEEYTMSDRRSCLDIDDMTGPVLL